MGVPYTWAKMRVTRSEDEISYSQRAALARPGTAQHDDGADRRRGDSDAAGGMAHGALGRTHPQGRADVVGAQRTLRPWPLRTAEILELDDDLLAASGVDPSGERLRAVCLERRARAVRAAVGGGLTEPVVSYAREAPA